MSWVIEADNGSTRDFDSQSEAEKAVPEIESLGLTVLDIRPKDSNETTSEAAPDGDGWLCPACNTVSKQCYRCTTCGHDLTDLNRGVGTGGGRQ